jgi:outer membrane protein assembly factor BamB
MSSEQSRPGRRFREHFFRRTALVAGIIAAVLCILLTVNYLQLQRSDPLNSRALERLILRLGDNPEEGELREEIRALDLLARRAYFSRRWQIRTASLMLLLSVGVLLVSLKVLGGRRKLTEEKSPSSPWTLASRSRIGVLVAVVLLLAAGLAAGIFSESALNRDYMGDSAVADTDAGGQAASEAPAAAQAETEVKENILDREELRRNWPSFRGPGGLGIAYVQEAPIRWDGISGEGIVWKTAIPKPGFNSPIIWDEKLFLSGADELGQEVYCLDRGSGEILWSQPIVNIPGTPAEPPDVSGDTGYAAPTMATDGTRVFAIFATGDVVCLDFEGTLLWSRNLGVPENHYGHSSSLLTYRDLLIVQYDHDGGSRLLALNSSNGDTVWETERMVMAAWSSPIVVYTGKRPEIILNANPFVASYDPDSGRELWQVECMYGEVGPSPTYLEGLVYAVNAFAQMVAIDVDSREILWQAFDDLPDAASPVAVEGCIYVPTSYGFVSCLDAKTGEIIWTHDFAETFYSSPIYAAGRIYLIDNAGLMHIFEAGREFNQVADCPLGEPSWAVPAFAENRIYLRGQQHLYCIGG